MDSFQELAESEERQIAAWEQRVAALVRAKGGSASAREFQRAVNVIFHDVEATQYDELHQEMWLSLPPVFDRLAREILRHSGEDAGWVLADVGCGTGLASELLLQTALKPRIAALRMVDTSDEMLRRCRIRATNWNLPTEFVHGQVDALPDASVDMVITCSVLHHLPKLFGFCQQLQRVIKPGGFYVHLHDPRRGALDDPIVVERCEQFANYRRRERNRVWRPPIRVASAVLRRARRWFASDYLDEVNRRLIYARLIDIPLKPNEIWSITDLRVGDLPYAAGDGISIDELNAALPDFEPISWHTYGFYGVLLSNLPAEFAAQERELFEASNGEGVFLAAVWRRQP